MQHLSRPDEDDISAGEFAPQGHSRANIEPLPMQTLDRTSVLDSDENNNDSQRSSSISEVPNQVKFENEFYNVFPSVRTSTLIGS